MKTEGTIKTKVEKITDFEFDKNKDGTYSYSFYATVGVKIKNSICTIKMYETDDRENPTKNDNGWDVYPKITVICTNDDYKAWVETLKSFDIEPDFTDIINQYNDELKKAKIENVKIEQEIRGKQWDECWVHSVVDEINSINPSVNPHISITRDKYIKSNTRGIGGVIIEYNDYSTTVIWENISTKRRETKYRYILNCKLTEYKRRSYVKVETLIKKFKELVDAEIETKKRNEKEKIEKIQLKQTTIEHLEKTFNLHVHSEDKRYSYGHGVHRTLGSRYTEYHLIKSNAYKEGEKYYSSSDLYKISVVQEDDGPMYWFAGLGKLTADQVKQILAVIE